MKIFFPGTEQYVFRRERSPQFESYTCIYVNLKQLLLLSSLFYLHMGINTKSVTLHVRSDGRTIIVFSEISDILWSSVSEGMS